ncbi:hypothetical protein Tco_0636208 [Tanacetum coccineum]
MPPLADLSFAGLDDYVYRHTTNKTSAIMSQVETSISQTSNTSVEMPRVESVRPSGVIIEDWVSDDDEDIFQSNDLQATDNPSFKRIEFTNAKNESVKPKQVKKHWIINPNPKVDREIGMGNNSEIGWLGFREKNTSQREIGPVWNNAQRINHQNKFVPSAVLTRLGRVPVSAAKQSSPRATTFKLTPNTRISNEKVNTVRVNGVNTVGQIAVSVVKGNGVTAVEASAGCVWRPKMTDLNNVSKEQIMDNRSQKEVGKSTKNASEVKGIFDSGCSRHMTRNKDFLIDYQVIDRGLLHFGGSVEAGKITGEKKSVRTN